MSTNPMISFDFDNRLVRTTDVNGEVWFVGKDICDVLGYANPRKAISDHCKEKGVTKRYTLSSGGEQKADVHKVDIRLSSGTLFHIHERK